MAETLVARQERLTQTLQALFQDQIPDGDFSVGTVLYELVVKPQAVILAQQEASLETVLNNFSLLQVLSTTSPDPTLVDRLLSNYNVVRQTGVRASGVINIFVNTTTSTFIPVDATFTCGGLTLKPNKAYVGMAPDTTLPISTDAIGYVSMRIYDSSTWVFAIAATSADVTDKVLSAGQVCTTDLALSNLVRVEIGSTFTGGQLAETTTALLQRAAVAITSRVVSGRDNIKSFLQTMTDVTVLDSAVFGMSDDLQLRDTNNSGGLSTGGKVDTYVKTAPVPTVITTVLSGTKSGTVWTIVIDKDDYPGAYGVIGVRYNTNPITEITAVLGYETDSTAPGIVSAVQARYSQYQTLSIQFEAEDVPGSTASFSVDIMYMPGLATVQTFLNQDSVRSQAFDNLVKAAIPIVVTVDVEIQYAAGLVPPTASAVQTAISNAINAKPIGTEALYVSEIVNACTAIFTAGEVKMPVTLYGRVWLPDGTTAYSTGQFYLKVMEEDGISYKNSMFCCFPGGVNVSLTELVV